jgi:hypothetical protein
VAATTLPSTPVSEVTGASKSGKKKNKKKKNSSGDTKYSSVVFQIHS